MNALFQPRHAQLSPGAAVLWIGSMVVVIAFATYATWNNNDPWADIKSFAGVAMFGIGFLHVLVEQERRRIDQVQGLLRLYAPQ